MTTLTTPQTTRATRPASRWRNRYLNLRDHFCDWNNKLCRAGEKDWGSGIWPSRDVAETKGRVSEMQSPGLFKYLGAFPVDQ